MTSKEQLKENLLNRIKGKTKEEAIKWLEDNIFYEEMEDFMNFENVACCKEIIKELKNEI